MKTPPLTEGFTVKGGRNQGESQIKDRPATPGPMTRAARPDPPKPKKGEKLCNCGIYPAWYCDAWPRCVSI